MEPARLQQIQDLYHAAVDHAPSERGAFLKQACGLDAELRREVESLLAQNGSSDGPMQRQAISLLAEAVVAQVSAGDLLGPYKIESLLGAGGMGQVYKARDTRLGRTVAIKIANQQFSDRFEREARAIAALNHSNICTLYDVGPNYLVMELIEGPTLADRIRQGPIPLAEALAVARQTADALEAAHEKGIVHRDLKPANVKIRPDGSVKVLDFGLAKAVSEEAEFTSDSPTVLSVSGMILGTAGYMSPEQARGQKVDKRADIWAFGVVLYEMVSGQRLFERKTLSDTLAAVIKEEPDLTRVPVKVQRLLRRCLEKDPNRRLRDISGVELLLEGESAAPSRSRFSKTGRTGWIAAGALAVVAVVALWRPWRAQKPVDRPLVRLDIDLGADVSLPAPTNSAGNFAISPDGRRLAYPSGTPVKLFTRRLDQPKATELPGTQGASMPFFSQDGRWVGFHSGGKLNKISVEGGAVVPLTEFVSFAGASWGEDGSILASEELGKGLVRISATGRPPETVAGLENGELGLLYPQILPGGKAILFAAATALDADKLTIEVLTLADRHRKIVARGGNSPRYIPSSGGATSGGAGYLIYVNKATLFAVPFDLDKLETSGTAAPVLDDVAYDSVDGAGQFDLSSTGTLVYRRASGVASTMTTVQWVDPAGRKEPLRVKPGDYEDPSLSPDGKQLALAVSEGGSEDVWIYDRERDAMTRLTFGGRVYVDPTWSPDGQHVVFAGLGGDIFQARADGAGQPQALTQSKRVRGLPSFRPDGKRLAYCDATGNYQIWTVPLENQGGQLKAGKPEQFLKSSFVDAAPSFSPDGRWLAYQSNESGKNEVYVRPFPPPSSGQSGQWQVSNSGGRMPHWSRVGHELMYQSGNQIMATSYAVKGDTFVPDKPRVWIARLGGTSWDLAPDGRRVVVVTPLESAEAPKQDHEVVFLLNFFDELRRRVPTGT
jgi:serine/threonine-protein kinase